MNLTDSTDWSFPVPILFGPGRIGDLAGLCTDREIRNPLIVTDRGSRELPFISDTVRILSGNRIANDVFSGFSPNPVDTEVILGKQAFEQGEHDAVIAIGGGSGMDGGKAVSLMAGREAPLWDFDFDHVPREQTGFVPLICIPTTAGTGAETDSTAMITDTGRGIKGCVWHPEQKPLAAILDPELTLELPRDLTAWTGCDALTHAIEAYVVLAFHPLCDGAALEAMRLISGSLTKAVNDPSDIEARAAMLVGSCLAGVAFLKGLGMVHAISHMVGAVHDTQHGLTNAVLLPAVLRFNRDSIADKSREMAAALGMPRNGSAGFEAGIRSLLDELDIPRNLGEIGVSDDHAEEIALKASRDASAGTNPRQASLQEIELLFLEALQEAR